ncbi:uncharacterized protein LOC111204086 [Brassica napus]|uniref:uncharacterized protein LOC111204086 n=1 Tax=Brassica napus TaxID=3708 RepID=UPI000BBEFA16|nr:uncharacterized protein LOC111204086 [Brassica napus]
MRYLFLKNTIALKGFALALPLVIVEDVPALTEVVQEVCSSSESESDDEESDCRIQKTKKKTLSPGHAREVDKKAEVFDILMRLVRSTVYNQVGSRGGKIPEFLDSRFVSLLARNYDRFRRSKSKESYVFAKGLVDCLVKSCSSGNASTRFYLPLNIDKNIGLGYVWISQVLRFIS